MFKTMHSELSSLLWKKPVHGDDHSVYGLVANLLAYHMFSSLLHYYGGLNPRYQRQTERKVVEEQWDFQELRPLHHLYHFVRQYSYGGGEGRYEECSSESVHVECPGS